jgi:Xaa-Pro aminopeptidase
MATQPDLRERDERIRRLQKSIRLEGLDALLVAGKGHWWSGRGYFRYLTDFHLHGMDGIILVPAEGSPMLSLSADRIAGLIADRGWITDVHGDPDIVPTMVEIMKRRGLSKARVGIAGQRFIMPLGSYQALVDGLPEVSFVKADHVMDRVRAIKSPLEILQQRELWSLAKAAMERFVEALEPGRTEWEMAAEAMQVVTAGGGRDTLIFFNGNPPEELPVKMEDVLGYHMEIEGPSGHWCELTVNLAYREPTVLERRLMDTELRMYEAIRSVAKPGACIKDMVATMERVYHEDGWTLSEKQAPHNDLHGQGLDVIEWPTYGTLDTRDGDVEFQEGMTFSYHPRRAVEPQARRPGINENIVITAEGVERLSEPWDLRWRVMV